MGKFKKVKNTINDFNKFKNIGEKIDYIKYKNTKKSSNKINALGFDLTFCVKKNSKKDTLKTAFLGHTILDRLTSEGARTPIFLNALFQCSF